MIYKFVELLEIKLIQLSHKTLIRFLIIMFKVVNSACSWIESIVKSQDMYSKPISFTFENKSRFSTFFGGTISLIILMAALIFGWLKFYTMITRQDAMTSLNQIVQDNASSGQSLYLNSSSFYFALKTNYNGTNILQNGGYLNVR